MNWSEFLLGQLLEAIYFPLFMIFAKNIKTRKLIFSITLIIEYFILVNIFKYNIWFQVSYTFMTYVILKYFYKEQSQITDIFTFCIGSVIMIIISSIVYFIFNKIYPNLIIAAITCRVILFTIIFVLNFKLYKIQNIYKKFWNRNDKVKKKMKSITFRCSNLIMFNLMFYFLSLLINYIK